MKRIVPGLYTFTGLIVGRVYLIEDPDGLTLVDTGLSIAADRVAKQLDEAGRSVREVKRMLITHAHLDHVGGLPKLKELSGAEVITSTVERPFAEGREPVVRPPREQLTGISRYLASSGQVLKGTPVDRTVEDGEVLDEVMGGLQVVSTPGHSPGHIAFWQPEKRVLFCGDVMMRAPGLRLPIAAFTVDMEQDKRSIGRLTQLEPSIICFGHGVPMMHGAAEQLKAFAGRLGIMQQMHGESVLTGKEHHG